MLNLKSYTYSIVHYRKEEGQMKKAIIITLSVLAGIVAIVAASTALLGRHFGEDLEMTECDY